MANTGVPGVNDYLKTLGGDTSAPKGGTAPNLNGITPNNDATASASNFGGINAYGNVNIPNPEHPLVTAGRQAYARMSGMDGTVDNSQPAAAAEPMSTPIPANTTPPVGAPAVHGVIGNITDLYHKLLGTGSAEAATGQTQNPEQPAAAPQPATGGAPNPVTPTPVAGETPAQGNQPFSWAGVNAPQPNESWGTTLTRAILPFDNIHNPFSDEGQAAIFGRQVPTNPLGTAPLPEASPNTGTNTPEPPPLDPNMIRILQDPHAKQDYFNRIQSITDPALRDKMNAEYEAASHQYSKSQGSGLGKEVPYSVPVGTPPPPSQSDKQGATIDNLLDHAMGRKNPFEPGSEKWQAYQVVRMKMAQALLPQLAHGMGYNIDQHQQQNTAAKYGLPTPSSYDQQGQSIADQTAQPAPQNKPGDRKVMPSGALAVMNSQGQWVPDTGIRS